jgi:hypothetical protein
MQPYLVAVLLAITSALAPAFAAPSGSHPITLGALPPSPILPGDLLTLRGKSRFTQGQLNGLEFFLGPQSAEVLFVDNNTVKVIVPPFVPEGPQSLTVMRHGRVEFSDVVPIGAIHVSAAGDEPDFRFGLNFADTKTFAVGTGVSGWLQTTDVKTGKSSPVSVVGKITGSLGGILSLSLTSDTSGTTGKLSVAALDLGTGKFFGSIFEVTNTVQITGTATVAVKPTIPVRTPPVITSVTPNPAPQGALITIEGRGFGAIQGISTVTWNGKPVIDFPRVTSWTDTRIVARLGLFDVGTAPIVVTVGQIPAIPIDLVVQRPCPPVTEFSKRFGGDKEDVAQAVQFGLPDLCNGNGFGTTGRNTPTPMELFPDFVP